MTRRRLTVALLASIAVNAALGIYALLAPHFGSTQGKVLGSSLCVTGAGVLALACFPAWERRRLGLIPLAGVATSSLACATAIAGMWEAPGSSTFGQVVGTMFTVAGACVLSSLLAIATLAPAYRRLFQLALVLIGLLAALILVGIWGHPASSAFPRALGVVSVLLAATTLALAILHRASRDVLAALAGAEQRLVRFCPSCGRPVPPGSAKCAACGAAFTVEWT